MKKIILIACMLFSFKAWSQPFTEGNLVVLRIGDGTVDLTNQGNKVFLDEYTTAGVLVRSIELPSANPSPLTNFVINGTNDTEGALTRSPNSLFVTLIVNTAIAPYGSSILSASATAVNRIVAWVGNTALPSYLSLNDYGNAPRCALTNNGTDFWLAGGAGGVSFRSITGTTTSSICTITTPAASTSFRTVAIADGNLYASTTIGTGNVRIGQIGTGLPTSAATYNPLAGIETNIVPHQFIFFDLSATEPGVDVMYVADESTGSTGGIRKYSKVSGTWVFNGQIGAAADKVRHIVGSVAGSTVTLFATSKGGNTAGGGGALVTVTDNAGYNIAPSATTVTELQAVANGSKIAYRGIAWAPTALPLPVVLRSFNAALADKNTARLWWSTAAETGVKEFVVEKSSNGRDFSPIGKVAALNKATGSDYTFTDNALAASAIVYYRIKVSDLDGSFSYSKVMRVSTEESKSGFIKVAPNPVAGNAATIVHDKAAVNAVVNVYTMQGKLVFMQRVPQGATQSMITMPAGMQGNFLVEYINGQSKATTRLVKL